MGEDMDTCMETLGITTIQEADSLYVIRGGRGNNILSIRDDKKIIYPINFSLDEAIQHFAKAVSRLSSVTADEVTETIYADIRVFDAGDSQSHQTDFYTHTHKAATMWLDRELIQFVYPDGARSTFIRKCDAASASKHPESQHLLLGESELKDALDEILAPIMEVK